MSSPEVQPEIDPLSPESDALNLAGNHLPAATAKETATAPDLAVCRMPNYEPIGRDTVDRIVSAATRDRFKHVLNTTASVKGLFAKRPRLNDLTPEVFAKLYDPASPTIGFDLTRRFGESGLLAVATQDARSTGVDMPNTLYLAPQSAGHVGAHNLRIYQDGRAILIATRGVLMDRDGNGYEGIFPKPVEVHLLGTYNWEGNYFLELGDRFELPIINNKKVMALTRSKIRTTELLREHGFLSPESVSVSAPPRSLADELKIKRQIEKLLGLSERSHVVIKPETGSGGKGIGFFHRDDLEGMLEYIKQFHARGVDKRRIQIQEYIECFPARKFGERGNHLEFNFRVIATQHGVVDAETRIRERVGHEIKPVNKSFDASIMEFHEIFDELRPRDPKRLEKVKAAVEKVAVEVTRLIGAGMLGLDILMDRECKLWFLEVNSGAVGGIKSLAEIREGDGRDAQLSAARGLVEHYRDLFFKEGKPNFMGQSYIEQPSSISPAAHRALASEWARFSRHHQRSE